MPKMSLGEMKIEGNESFEGMKKNRDEKKRV